MNSKRTHCPSVLGAEAAQKELMRLRQLKALEAAAGTWKDKDHPELKQGAAKWVEKMRGQDEKRFRTVTRH